MEEAEIRRIAAFQEQIGLDRPVTREDLRSALEGAIRDRGLYLYFIWKSIQKKLPEEEADEVIRDAMHTYGLYKSKGLGEVTNAAEGMLNQSSRNGMIVFDQEFTALTDDYAEKVIRNCPLVNAFREVGATEEETKKLCQDLLGVSDRALLEPFADAVEVSFPKTLSSDDVCVMCVRKTCRETGK
jgi:hypothetical protein